MMDILHRSFRFAHRVAALRQLGWPDWIPLAGPATPQRYRENLARYRGDAALDLPKLLDGYTRHVSPGNADMTRFYSFCLLFDQLIKEGVEGDVAELGVYRGSTAFLLVEFARRMGTTAWLFDTFDGFDLTDRTGMDADKTQQFDDTSLAAVRAWLGERNIRYVPGHFPGTTTAVPDERRFCLIHVDCDLEMPAQAALEYFYPRMVPGGAIVLHDYTSLHWNGMERAIDRFFGERAESPVPMPDGAGSAVVRIARDPVGGRNWFTARRQVGIASAWLGAAQGGALQPMLTSGWWAPEDWGVWGVGAWHQIDIELTTLPESGLFVDVDCHVSSVPARRTREIGTRVGERLTEPWKFTTDANRAVRSLHIERQDLIVEQGMPIARLRFDNPEPHVPADATAGHQDQRRLGLGIFRLRCRLA